MADPLSVVASIIALIGAAESIGKTLNRIRDITNAPNEVLALSNEISDLTVVLKHVETYVTAADCAVISRDNLKHLSILAKRAQSRLDQLERIMHSHLPEPGGANRRSSLRRLQWPLLKTKVDGLRVDLRDIKLSIIVQMNYCHRVCYYKSIFPFTLPIDVLIVRNSRGYILLLMRFCSQSISCRRDKPGCVGKLNFYRVTSSITCCQRNLGPCDRSMVVTRTMEMLNVETTAGYNRKYESATPSLRPCTTIILAFLFSESEPIHKDIGDLAALLLANARVIEITKCDPLHHSTRFLVSYSLATAVLRP